MEFREGYKSPHKGRAPSGATTDVASDNSCLDRRNVNSNPIKEDRNLTTKLWRASGLLAVAFLATALAAAGEDRHGVLVRYQHE